MLLAFWNDEDGVILSAELVLIGTILVLGLIVGLVEFQTAVVAELSDLGDAVGNLDQSYRTSSVNSMSSYAGMNSTTAGACYIDGPDCCVGNAIISGDAAMSVGENSSGYGKFVPATDCAVEIPPTEAQQPVESQYTEE